MSLAQSIFNSVNAGFQNEASRPQREKRQANQNRMFPAIPQSNWQDGSETGGTTDAWRLWGGANEAGPRALANNPIWSNDQERAYLRQRPDVAQRIQQGVYGSGLEHFERSGRNEGMQLFNEQNYLMANPDVGRAVAGGLFSSGLDHFLRVGADERRPLFFSPPPAAPAPAPPIQIAAPPPPPPPPPPPDPMEGLRREADDFTRLLFGARSRAIAANPFDSPGFSSLEGEVANLSRQFSSLNQRAAPLIGGPLLGADIEAVLQEATSATGRAGERAREVLSRINEIEGQGRSLTIQQEAEMRSLLTEAQSLSGMVGDNFVGTPAARSALQRLQQLVSQRDAEERRGVDFFRALAGEAGNLAPLLDGVDHRNGMSIASMRANIERVMGQARAFSTPLERDFVDNELMALLEPIRSRVEAPLSQIEARRRQSLENFVSNARNIAADVDLVNLADEAEMRRRLTAIDELRAELSAYTGADVNDINTRINQSRDPVRGRLQQLFDRRDDIERRSGAGLTSARDENIGSLQRVGELEAMLEALRAEADQFGASQAGDELTGLGTLVRNERTRLMADMEAIERRRRAEMEAMTQSRSAAATPFAPLEMAATFGRRPRVQEPTWAQSAFSRALGVGVA